jgi:hypothetical protein
MSVDFVQPFAKYYMEKSMDRTRLLSTGKRVGQRIEQIVAALEFGKFALTAECPFAKESVLHRPCGDTRLKISQSSYSSPPHKDPES